MLHLGVVDVELGVVKQTTLRRIRETAVAKHVKDVHGNQCQVCGIALLLPGGTYSEAAHIRALGKPHLGPDTVDNILCLCPNHHVLFDRGSIWIDDNFRVQPADTPLIAPHLHPLDIEHVRYHRNSRAPS